MTVSRLKEQIAFDAGIPDIDALGGWLDLTLQEVFDQHTALTKYNELYVANSSITTVAPFTGALTLPSDLQHLDTDNVRVQIGGNATREYFLTYSSAPTTGVVTANGISTFFWSGTNLTCFPAAGYSQVDIGTIFYFNYWKKADLSNDSTIIIPDVLVSAVKAEMIYRATNDDGRMAKWRKIANEAKSRSMGATDLGSAN